ncbi:MAG: hypothetical protein Q8Q54_00545 [Methylococcales bacterium]|nr:hypothetical protein [Methylococcales bacterium]
MSNIESKLAQLKNKLESTAFLVTKQGSEQQAHSEIVQCLIILSDIEAIYSNAGNGYSSSDNTINNEINKVSSRLKLWAKRPDQINSRILNAFLKLERSGLTVITENALKGELSELNSFESNFVQMKTIAERNHGKVFEQNGDEVTLWQPIIPYVRQYEKMARLSTDNEVTGKVVDVKEHGNLRDVILEDGQSFPTSYSNHSLEALRQYIGKRVILVISPKGFLFGISAVQDQGEPLTYASIRG